MATLGDGLRSKPKKTKKHRASTRLFSGSKGKTQDAIPIPTIRSDTGTSIPPKRKSRKLSRSQSFTESPEVRRLESITTQLTLEVAHQSNGDKKSKRRTSSEIGSVITGEQVLSWIQQTQNNAKPEKIEATAQSLFDSGMLIPTRNTNTKFNRKDTYLVSYPLFKGSSITSISGVLTPFLASSDFLLLAKDRGNTDVIVKRRQKTPESTKNIQREAHVLSRTKNTGFPTLLSLSQSSASFVMIQEFQEASNLFSRVLLDGPLSENAIIYIAFQVAAILEVFHEQNLAYGLLNLKSIYVHGNRAVTERSQISLVDTGHVIPIGKEFHSPPATLFTPPEFLTSTPKVHITSDMWSLGVCLYWLLFGYPPYVCSDLSNLPKVVLSSPVFSVVGKEYFSISPVTRMILLQLLNPDPERRITAADLSLWPRKDISNLNQQLSYPYNSGWKSYQQMRIEGSSVVVEKDDYGASQRKGIRSLWGRNSNKKVLHTFDAAEVGICSVSSTYTKSFVRACELPLNIDNFDMYNNVTIENISTRFHTISIDSLSTWQPAFSILSHLYFLVDLRTIDITHQITAQTFQDQVKAFETLYMHSNFYDKIRALIYNVPLTIVFLNTDILQAIWMKSDKNISLTGINRDSFDSVLKALETVFVSIKNRSPVPRVLKSISFASDDVLHFMTYLTSNSESYLTRCEAKDADSIIQRVIKLKLKRVHINFPFGASSRSKVTQLSNLSGALRGESILQDINMCNLGIREKDFIDSSMFEAFAENKSITSLNLSYNALGDTGITSLCKALYGHEFIESLILMNTKFTVAGAECVAKLITSLPNLSLLDVSRNCICDEGIIAIAESLHSNNTIKSIHFEDCGFYEGGFLALCSLLEIHPLKYLNISANVIPNSLMVNLALSLRRSMLSTPIRIKLPRFVEHRMIRMRNKKLKAIYKSHKDNRFISQDENNSNLSEYIESISQRIPQRRNYAYCNLPNFCIPVGVEWRSLNEIICIDLSHNKITRFPIALLQLEALEELSLAYNQLKDIGKLFEMNALRRLSLCSNRIENISGIGKLSSLRFLDLRWNTVRALPTVGDLENLEQLLLDGNYLLKIEFGIQSLPKLKNLSLHNNLIPLPKILIFEAWSRDIRILNLCNLSMEYIPKEIYLLRSVCELNLSNNKISELPPQIGKLSCLRVLDLSHNQLLAKNILSLLYLDLSFISLVGNEQLASAWTSPSLTPHILKELLMRESEGATSTEIHRAKLMLVGKTGVGKTVVSTMLRTPSKQRKRTAPMIEKDSLPTDGIAVNEWKIDTKSNPPATLAVWDMAGADVYKTTHAFFLEERSLFLLLFNLTINESKQDVRYWLQMITASAPDSPVLLVGTHAEFVDPEDISAVGNAMIKKYSSTFSNITNFISICSFNPTDIETLHESILTQFRAQKYLQKKVPAGYSSLISLIEAERHLCNPPFASTREFEFMVMNCGIESSIQTVAEYLNLLGVISYFNDSKLGVSSSIVLDPSWLISLISTIITSRDNGIHDGVLYHDHLPTLWANYPVSLYPFLIDLFNKIELLYTSKEPHPERGVYSLIPSTFSTNKLGAQSKFIPIDDFLALGLGTQLERIYQFDFLPFGFFSRLVVRLLHFTTPSFYWRTGLVCQSGENSGLVEFEMGRELSVKVRGRNPAKLLRVIVENIDLLLTGWYRNNATVIVPFILKGANYQKVGLDHKFSLEELENAAAFGKTEIEFKSGNTSIPIRIDSIAPDLVMADISEMLMKWDDLTIEKQVGQGAFGKVYAAIYKGKRVAVKQIEVEANMKTEAYREFRREVALCSELQNPAIVALCGVCLDPWCLALEFMPHGDLYTFLKDTTNRITWKMRITMAHNIAEAIRFLHSFQPKIIHRDLKSPNCLMASIDPNAEYLVKVTDFGESRAVATSYTGRDRLHNPVWLAPEIMKKEQYTEKADVFSFGIIMWELVGRTKPFDEYEIAKSSFTYQLEDAIIEGLRPTIPKDKFCPPAYIQLMESCWDGDPKARPQFEDICKQVKRLRESISTEIANSE